MISKHIKKFVALLAMILIAFSLIGCDSSNRVSKGSIDTKATYLSAGNYSVTVGEIYDKLRYSSTSWLENAIYEVLFKEEIDELVANVDKYSEKLNELVLEDIFGTSDEKEIAKLSDDDYAAKATHFCDEMYMQGFSISADDIKNGNLKAVYPYFYLDVAKYIAAWNKLAKDFTVENGKINFGEINKDSHFTTDEVVNYYKANKVDKGDVTAVLVRFMNQKEANNVLKAFGIKVYNGAWYQIPLSDDEDDYSTKKAYEEYYDGYTINPSDTEGISSIEVSANGAATILKLFCEVYNYIYTFRNAIVYDEALQFSTFTNPSTYDHLKHYYFAKAIIDKDANYRLGLAEDAENTEYADVAAKVVAYNEAEGQELTVMSNEKLNKYNSSLATYIYSSLETEAAEGEETFVQYTPSAKSYGNYYFSVFKVAQAADEVLYTETTDGDKKTYSFEGHEEYLQKVLEEMFEEELTDDYINEVFEARCKDAKIKIFDSVVELEFMQSSSKLAENYSKTKKKDNNNLAEVKYQKKTTKISVADFYNSVEPIYGPQYAVQLVFDKYIKSTEDYSKLEKNYDNYKEQIETMLYYFTNDYYASYGYDSSIGKFNFLRLIYQETTIDEIIHNSLMVSDAKNKFFYDVTKDLAGDAFFTALKDYVDEQYAAYYNLTASNIYAYVDFDEDGEADELTDGDAIYALAQELIEKVITEVKATADDFAGAVDSVIADYNNSSRFETENPTEVDYLWAKYRKAGLYLGKADVTATNTSKIADSKLQNRLAELYDAAGVMNSETGFTSAVLDNSTIQTTTGYSVLLLTAGSNPSSAKYGDSEKAEKLYKDITVVCGNDVVTVTISNYNNTIPTVEQIKVYVLDYVLLGSVASLPAETVAALDAFVKPMITRYVSSASQYVQMVQKLGTLNYEVSTAVNPRGDEAWNNAYSRSTFLNKYMDHLKSDLDEYKPSQYANWWTKMYGGNN